MYKKVGEINSFEEIPWNEPIIITGSIDGSRSWFWKMPGVFRKDNDDFRFVDDFGMSTRFGKKDSISLNILEKQIGVDCFCCYAHKPEKEDAK